MSKISTHSRPAATRVTRAATTVTATATVEAAAATLTNDDLPPPAASTLDSLRATLEQVRARLALVIQSAESDSGSAEFLLSHVKESLLPAAIDALRAPSFGKADLIASYEGLYVPLAMIEGAIAVFSDSVFEPALREAHALLEWVHSEMAIGDALYKSLPAIDTKASSFNKGRDLAIEMLKAGEALDHTDQAEPYRWMRRGAAQNRFALPFLHQLLAQPELMDGFAAVLSGRLGTGDSVHNDYFALDRAEYEAGEVGADSTVTGDGANPAAPEQCAPAATKSKHLPSIQDAYTVLSEARDVLESCLVDMLGPAHGANDLLKIACDAFGVATESGNAGDCEEASNALSVALEVLEIVSERSENLVADAAFRLATQAKRAIDAVIDQMIQERRS